MSEIYKRIQRAEPQIFNQRGFTFDNVTEALKHYEKLGVTYVDPDSNVAIL